MVKLVFIDSTTADKKDPYVADWIIKSVQCLDKLYGSHKDTHFIKFRFDKTLLLIDMPMCSTLKYKINNQCEVEDIERILTVLDYAIEDIDVLSQLILLREYTTEALCDVCAKLICAFV